MSQYTDADRERAKMMLKAMNKITVDNIQEAINKHKNRPDLALKKIYDILGVE